MLIIVLLYVVSIPYGDALPCSWSGGSTLSCYSTEQHKTISLLTGQIYQRISVIRIHGSPSLLLLNGDLFPQLQAIIGDIDCSRVVGVQVLVNGKWCSAIPYHPSHPYKPANNDDDYNSDGDTAHDEGCRVCEMKSEVTTLLIMAVLAALGIPSGLALRWYHRRRRNARRSHRRRHEEENMDDPPTPPPPHTYCDKDP
ncbi:uncharacterized protein [Haliotis cracherodii]|uniref:uncharacterized protein n=1 Tax=Haliotis cracherodii TaxID=6455 RepID=UPI0039EB12DD